MYDVLLNATPVGYALVDREGLYYKIRCSCKFPNRDVYIIQVSDGERFVRLGVCVPEGDRFTMCTKIPVKKMQGNAFWFTAVSRNGNGISVDSDNPFAYIDQLATARLQKQTGK